MNDEIFELVAVGVYVVLGFYAGEG